MILAKNLENLGTESAFSVLAEAKALEAKGHPMIHLGLGLLLVDPDSWQLFLDSWLGGSVCTLTWATPLQIA